MATITEADLARLRAVRLHIHSGREDDVVLELPVEQVREMWSVLVLQRQQHPEYFVGVTVDMLIIHVCRLGVEGNLALANDDPNMMSMAEMLSLYRCRQQEASDVREYMRRPRLYEVEPIF